MTRKTKAAEKALKAVMASLPKAQLVSRRIPGTVALPVATNEASLLVYLHRWPTSGGNCGPPPTGSTSTNCCT